MEQVGVKNNARSRCGVELASLERKKKNEKVSFSAPPGSVCRRRFSWVTMDLLGVKSLVEHDGEG